jgi:23S rRNA A1618 N6-methylase RlmF
VKAAEKVHYYITTYTTLLQKNDFSALNKALLDNSTLEKKTFIDGMICALVENLYNYLAYIVEIFNDTSKS